MKIAIANASYPPNVSAGAERVVLTLARELGKRGHEVVVITTQPQGAATTGSVEGTKVHYLPVVNVYRPFSRVEPGAARKAIYHAVDSFNPFMRRALGEVLDQERPDVVNTHNLAGFSVAALKAVRDRGLPLVHTLHDQYLLCFRCTMFKGESSCRRRCIDCRLCSLPRKIMSADVDVVTGASRFILDRHLRAGYFRSAQNRVVYNGMPEVGPLVERRRTDRPFRFGFLGQVRRAKGLHLLIEAFLAARLAGAELWVAGSGDRRFEEELRGRTADQPTVRWLGFVSPAELLGSVDVLVVPSIWQDTAPLVILEAFAHGVPVLAAKRGGIPEFVPPGTGWVFDPEQPQEFKRSLERCMEQESELGEFGRRAYASVQTFNVERFVQGYLDAYAAAVERSFQLSRRRPSGSGNIGGPVS